MTEFYRLLRVFIHLNACQELYLFPVIRQKIAIRFVYSYIVSFLFQIIDFASSLFKKPSRPSQVAKDKNIDLSAQIWAFSFFSYFLSFFRVFSYIFATNLQNIFETHKKHIRAGANFYIKKMFCDANSRSCYVFIQKHTYL